MCVCGGGDIRWERQCMAIILRHMQQIISDTGSEIYMYTDIIQQGFPTIPKNVFQHEWLEVVGPYSHAQHQSFRKQNDLSAQVMAGYTGTSSVRTVTQEKDDSAPGLDPNSNPSVCRRTSYNVATAPLASQCSWTNRRLWPSGQPYRVLPLLRLIQLTCC